MAKRIKFPPLAPGSEVDITELEMLLQMFLRDDCPPADESPIMQIRMLCALAAAEWEDVTYLLVNTRPFTEKMFVKMNNARCNAHDWHNFRREHCNGK